MPFINHVPQFDFLKHKRKAAAVSVLWWLFSMVLIFGRGPSLGIDFTGGTEIRLRFASEVTIDQVRASVNKVAIAADSVQQVGADEDHEFVIRVQDPTFGSDKLVQSVNKALTTKFGDGWIADSSYDAEVGTRMTVRYTGEPVQMQEIRDALVAFPDAKPDKASDENTFHVKLPSLAASVQETLKGSIDQKFEVLQVDSVGPSVGAELRNQGFLAVGVTCLLIMVYVGMRFDMSFAPGAIIALLHDIINVVGVFIVIEMTGLMSHEFNLNIIGALLTILGYSINDTIIIYDRIRENQKKYRRKPLSDIMNISVNETLGRTIGTSLTTILSMVPFLFLGGDVIRTFSLAIILGVLFGTYSTVFVASPLTLVFEDLRPYFEKLMAGGASADADGSQKALTESELRRREREAKAAERKGKDHL